MASSTVKKIPESELQNPGCLCKTKSGQEYIKTSSPDRKKHTLWKVSAEGYEKVTTLTDMNALDAKIPWEK